MTTTPEQTQLYGGWRRSRSMGIGMLNTTQTGIVVGCVLLPLLAGNTLGWSTLPVTAPIAVVVTILACWQVHGMPLLDLAAARFRWQIASFRGETSFRGQFLQHPKALDLPGVAAPTALLRVEDSAGPRAGRAGLVWNQATGKMAASYLLASNGALLANRAQVDSNVMAWGNAIAGLANEAAVDAATLTLQITPSTGAAMADHVLGRMDKAAPALATATARELVASAPRASSSLAAWFTLVVSPGRGADKPTSPAEAAAETLRTLDGVDLLGAGADVVRRCTDTDILRLVLGAFRPADADAPESEMRSLTWDEAGPVAAEDGWTTYHHDSAVSMSYVLREAPRKPITYDVLLPLLSPGQYPRRVTLGYRVLSTPEAAGVVERELNASDAREQYRRRSQRTTTRRERADAAAAERTAEEEAYGAGLVQWTISITVTVPEGGDIKGAQREIDTAARRSGGLRFRPAFGGQAAAFVYGLPVGIHPLA